MVVRKFAIAFLLILTLLPFGFCQTEQSFEKGLEFFQAKDFKSAILHLEFALTQEPQNPAIKENLISAYQAYAQELADKKDWGEAIEYLKKAHNLAPQNSDIRNALSAYYNNYAIVFSNENEFIKAKDNLLLALFYNPQSPALEKNLSTILTNQAYYQYRDGLKQEAIDILQEALRHNFNNTEAYSTLGQILYEENRFDEAAQCWEQALKLNPTQKNLKEKIKKALTDSEVEKKFKKHETENFIVTFDDKNQRDLGYDISQILNDAYRNIGWRFDHYPKNKISVVIYTRRQFAEITTKDEWVLGIYEGRIRLPLSDGQLNPDLRENIIYHEYTHALINDLFSGKIPIWVHEGIAQSQEPNHQELDRQELALLKGAIKNKAMIPIESLEVFLSQPAQSREFFLANLEAKLFIEYLLYRYSYYMLKEVLKEVSSGKDFSQAAQKVLYIPLDRLWENWVQSLKEKYL